MNASACHRTAGPRLAVVTGAGSGLGRAFCGVLAGEKQWHVVAVDVDPAGLEQTRSTFAALALETTVMDVADAAAWSALAQRLQRDWPRLDLLINNAGVCLAAEVGAGSLEAWRRVHAVNYGGVLNGCHALAPWIRTAATDAAQPKPAIINVASIAGLIGLPALGAYSAAKAAVVALSESLYAELRPAGVNVTVVTPGFFRTELLARGTFADARMYAYAERMTRTATFTAADVARAALAASRRGQLYSALGRRARWYWRCKRLAPQALLRSISRGYSRTMGDGDRPG